MKDGIPDFWLIESRGQIRWPTAKVEKLRSGGGRVLPEALLRYDGEGRYRRYRPASPEPTDPLSDLLADRLTVGLSGRVSPHRVRQAPRRAEFHGAGRKAVRRVTRNAEALGRGTLADEADHGLSTFPLDRSGGEPLGRSAGYFRE